MKKFKKDYLEYCEKLDKEERLYDLIFKATVLVSIVVLLSYVFMVMTGRI